MDGITQADEQVSSLLLGEPFRQPLLPWQGNPFWLILGFGVVAIALKSIG